MLQTKQITLSLFLSGTMAATLNSLGPLPIVAADTSTSTDNMYVLGINTYGITTIGKKEALHTSEQSSKDSTLLHVGLYACVTSGLVGLPTQTINGATGNKLAVQSRSVASTRAFYQTTLAHVGVAPTTQPTAGVFSSTTIPFVNTVDESSATGGIDYTNTGVGMALKIADVAGDFFECCPHETDTLKDESQGFCLTKVTWDVATDDFDTTAVTLITDRVSITNITVGHTGTLSTAQVNYGYEADFLLGSLSQLSDEADNNWCTKSFQQVLIANETKLLGALDGFSSKTKCTWQLTSSSKTKAPQFKVKAALTSQFWIQWIEASLTGLTAGLLLPAAPKLIGDYKTDEGMFFNPFKVDVSESVLDSGELYANSATSHVDSTYYAAGTPGFATLYLPIGKSHQLISQTATSGFLTAGVAAAGFTASQSLYNQYTTEVTAFNVQANKYNTDLTAYQTAVTAGTATASLPEAPVRPCTPTALPAYKSIDTIDIVMNKKTKADRQEDVVEAIHNDKGVLYYVHQSGEDVDATHTIDSDSFRFGHVFPDPDTTDSSSPAKTKKYDDATTFAGHVFGRLGQGPMNMPDKILPWQWNSDHEHLNTMQVSIFPSGGEDFVLVDSDDYISIEVSEAVFDTSPFTLPSTPGTLALTPLNATSATALALSAVAMTVAAAALY